MKPICIHNGTVISGYSTKENCSVLVEEGIIKEIFPCQNITQKSFNDDIKILDVKGAYITPGFIDTHIHGYMGYGADDAIYPEAKPQNTVENSLLKMSQLLVKNGVTSFNPTVYPASANIMPNALSKIVNIMGKEEGAKIMGLHLEGPFLSPDMLGVQRKETISPVDLHFMEKLIEASNGHITNMTIAPEIPHIKELASFCIKERIVLQAGHTNAVYEDMVNGMLAGVLHSTHMFNAMSKLSQRNPNAAGAILTSPDMSFEIIADGVHVHPVLFKLIYKCKSPDKIVLITDSLKCSNQETGPYYANGEEMYLKGGVCIRKKDDVIGGSEITMIKGVENLVKFGFSLENAVKAASSNPARIMGYSNKGFISPNMDADITVFDRDFNVLLTMVGGKICWNDIKYE